MLSVGDQFVELTNATDGAVPLAGYSIALRDGSTFVLPRGASVPAHSSMLLYGSTTLLVINPAGDLMTLHGPDGASIDDVAVPALPPDAALIRTTDGTGSGDIGFPATPTRLPASSTASRTPTPMATVTVSLVATPTAGSFTHVYLSRILSNPRSGDGRGVETFEPGNQIIELANPLDERVPLTGYALTAHDSQIFVFSRGTGIGGHDQLTLLGSQDLLVIGQQGDTIRLLDAMGVPIDEATVPVLLPNQSMVRRTDGSGGWDLLDQATATPTPHVTSRTGTPSPTQRISHTPTPTRHPTNTMTASATPTAHVATAAATARPTAVHLSPTVSAPLDVTGDASRVKTPTRVPTIHATRTVRPSLKRGRTSQTTHHVRKLRHLPHDTDVTIEGQVTYRAGLHLGARAMVLQQDEVGILVRTTFDLEPIPLDTVVTVRGRVYRTEEGIAVLVTLADNIEVGDMGAPVRALEMATAHPTPERDDPDEEEEPVLMVDRHVVPQIPEGVLLLTQGNVVRRDATGWILDTSIGPVRVRGASLSTLQPTLHGVVQATGVFIYRTDASEKQTFRREPFGSLLAVGAQPEVLTREPADVLVLPVTPTPTRTPRPTRTPTPTRTAHATHTPDATRMPHPLQTHAATHVRVEREREAEAKREATGHARERAPQLPHTGGGGGR